MDSSSEKQLNVALSKEEKEHFIKKSNDDEHGALLKIL
jgi:hypothetical protein